MFGLILEEHHSTAIQSTGKYMYVACDHEFFVQLEKWVKKLASDCILSDASLHTSQVAYQASICLQFHRLKRLGVFLLLDGLLVHCRVTTSV